MGWLADRRPPAVAPIHAPALHLADGRLHNRGGVISHWPTAKRVSLRRLSLPVRVFRLILYYKNEIMNTTTTGTYAKQANCEFPHYLSKVEGHPPVGAQRTHVTHVFAPGHPPLAAMHPRPARPSSNFPVLVLGLGRRRRGFEIHRHYFRGSALGHQHPDFFRDPPSSPPTQEDPVSPGRSEPHHDPPLGNPYDKNIKFEY
ncbi:hypothetical protein B0H13DRAFT_2393462 [Mycena leptocephala]|nr:hypothetical protein B0H13DRAFT_2393462 [Mycena leptocephala]